MGNCKDAASIYTRRNGNGCDMIVGVPSIQLFTCPGNNMHKQIIKKKPVQTIFMKKCRYLNYW